jgi:hypothetical protein
MNYRRVYYYGRVNFSAHSRVAYNPYAASANFQKRSWLPAAALSAALLGSVALGAHHGRRDSNITPGDPSLSTVVKDKNGRDIIQVPDLQTPHEAKQHEKETTALRKEARKRGENPSDEELDQRQIMRHLEKIK